MKRLVAIFSSFSLLLTLGMSTAFGASGGGGGGGSQAPSCDVTNTCKVYVDDVMISMETGSISEPFRSITAAVDYVKNNGDYNTIRIAGGSYGPNDSPGGETFPLAVSNLGRPLHIQGGYNETFSTIDPDAYPTNVDADGSDFLDLTMTGGSVKGLNITGADLALNVSNNNNGAGNMLIENNIFSGNEEAINMMVQGDNSATVQNNEFTGNESLNNDTVGSFNGGTDNMTVKNNVFYSNSTEATFFCEDALVYNNFFLQNDAAIVAEVEGYCSFYHNTVAYSTANSAVATSGNNNLVLNNLITNTSGGTSFTSGGGNNEEFDYNALFGNDSDPGIANDNLVCDPIYPVPNGSTVSEYEIDPTSDCIDEARNLTDVTVDYFGTSRPADGDGLGSAYSDPGAYEAPDLNIAAPVISNAAVSHDPFSPNGDGYQDTTTLSFDLSETATVSVIVEVNNMKHPLIDNEVRSPGTITVDWDGTYEDGGPQDAEDGTYILEIEASNAGGIDTNTTTGVKIDRTLEAPEEGTQETEETEETTEEPTGQCGGYSDVPASHPSCDAIEYAQSIGAMTGNPDGTFDPNEALQRDQVAKISLETYGLFDENEDYCGGSNPFPDVTSSAWSYQYICRGVDLGMITGYEAGEDAGKYIPARSVNRVEFLALILRNLSETMPPESSASYDDVDPGQWFSGYAKYSQDNDLFEGMKLFPTNTTTRVEVADVIYKLNQLGKI